MSSSNVWTRSRARMKLFPELLAQCSGEVHIHPVFLPRYCFVCVCVCVSCRVCVCVWERERCIILWIPPFVVVCTSVCFFYYYIIRQLLMVHVWPPQPLANRSWPKTCVSRNLKHWKAAFNQLWVFFVIMQYIEEYFLTRIPFTQIYIREKKIYILLLHI